MIIAGKLQLTRHKINAAEKLAVEVPRGQAWGW